MRWNAKILSVLWASQSVSQIIRFQMFRCFRLTTVIQSSDVRFNIFYRTISWFTNSKWWEVATIGQQARAYIIPFTFHFKLYGSVCLAGLNYAGAKGLGRGFERRDREGDWGRGIEEDELGRGIREEGLGRLHIDLQLTPESVWFSNQTIHWPESFVSSWFHQLCDGHLSHYNIPCYQALDTESTSSLTASVTRRQERRLLHTPCIRLLSVIVVFTSENCCSQIRVPTPKRVAAQQCWGCTMRWVSVGSRRSKASRQWT